MKIIDCHNHSLPNIDDGATSIEMSLEMLSIAEKNGTTNIILTPHHLNGAFSNFTESVIEKTKELQKSALENGLSIKLHYGTEVHVVTETADHLLNNKALTYCGLGKAALLELPKHSIPNGVERIFSELIYNGITPIIAHPERNTSLRRDIEPLKDWVNFGCKAQLTGQSCTGDFGSSIQRISFDMINQNLVHLVASDAHRPKGRGPDLIGAASILSKTFNDQISQTLLYTNPLRLIEGKDLMPLACHTQKTNYSRKKQKDKKTSIFSFFKK